MESNEIVDFYHLKESYYRKLQKCLSKIISISEDDFDLIKKQFKIKVIPKNSQLLNMGEYWSIIYFIKRGVIRLYYVSEDGREFNKGFFFEGMFLWPILPAARNYPSNFSIETMEPCEMLSCNFYKFQDTFKRLDYWHKFSLYYIEWLAELKSSREADFLLLSAQMRYLRFIESYKKIIDRIPDYHIASYLGITGVALSRIKKRPIQKVTLLRYANIDQTKG
ncbi:MAG: Crp/Fnr family transcriptional regulator [Desulfobacteraceae bacterium]|jgi:CRP-like cAMP-binding protein